VLSQEFYPSAVTAGRSPPNKDLSLKGEAKLAELMRAANRGDADAYRNVLCEVSPMLRGFARHVLLRYGLSIEDTEDIVQETLLAMHLKRDTWVDSKPFLPWVRAIAHHKLVDHFRRTGRARHFPIEEFGHLLVADPTASISSGLDADTAIARLKGRQRQVVIGISVNGKSARQMAQELRMSEGAVRVMFHRALQTLSKVFRNDQP
jgi:RNA polymerase sigma-70 factor, ECF subfamily